MFITYWLLQAVIINYRNIMKLIPIVLLSEKLLCFTPMKTQCSQVNISIFMILIFCIFFLFLAKDRGNLKH